MGSDEMYMYSSSTPLSTSFVAASLRAGTMVFLTELNNPASDVGSFYLVELY